MAEPIGSINSEKEQVVQQELESVGFTVSPTKIEGLRIMVASRHDYGRLGMMVRGRERARGDHETTVHITKPSKVSAEERLLEFERVCRGDGLTPWIAVYVHASGDLYATSVANFRARYRGEVKIPTWYLDKNAKARYGQDEEVMHVNMQGSDEYPIRWFGGKRSFAQGDKAEQSAAPDPLHVSDLAPRGVPPLVDDVDLDEVYSEGRELLQLHRRKERNRKAVQRKKEQVLAAQGKLFCEVCDFDFTEVYGTLGEGFAECHHRIPLANLTEVCRIRLSELAIVCANCHRMLHRRPFHTVEGLQEIVRKRRGF